MKKAVFIILAVMAAVPYAALMSADVSDADTGETSEISEFCTGFGWARAYHTAGDEDTVLSCGKGWVMKAGSDEEDRFVRDIVEKEVVPSDVSGFSQSIPVTAGEKYVVYTCITRELFDFSKEYGVYVGFGKYSTHLRLEPLGDAPTAYCIQVPSGDKFEVCVLYDSSRYSMSIKNTYDGSVKELSNGVVQEFEPTYYTAEYVIYIDGNNAKGEAEYAFRGSAVVLVSGGELPAGSVTNAAYIGLAVCIGIFASVYVCGRKPKW